MQAVLWLSVGLNGLFLTLGIWFVNKRGGLSFLANYKTLGIAGLESDFPYYNHRKSQLKLLPLQASDIIFLGDSITDEGEWSELLKHPGIKNRGISSDTTIGVLSRLESILKAPPQTIFLMIGVNDLSRRRSLSEITQTYNDMLTKFHTYAPTTQVVVQSVLPINSHSFQNGATNHAIAALNVQIQRLASEYTYLYLDLHPHFLDAQKQLDRQYTSDGLHLNGAAYIYWAQLIKAQSIL